MSSCVEYKSLNELMKNGWSYFVRSGGGGPGVGIYAWEKYIELEDGTRRFASFVVADNKNAFPTNDCVDGCYYKRCFDDSQTCYTIVGNGCEAAAELVGQEVVDGTTNVKKIAVSGGLGTATASQVLAGVTFTSDSGVQQTGTLEIDSGGLVISVRIDDKTYPVTNASDPEEQPDGSYTIRIK